MVYKQLFGARFKHFASLYYDGGVFDMELRQVFSPELDCSVNWYAISSSMAEGKFQDYAKSDIFNIFLEELVEIKKSSLVDENGSRVKDECFSSRKRDTVFVGTLFGILCRFLRKKRIENDPFLKSKDFQAVRELLRKVSLKELAGNGTGAILDTPPPTPESPSSKIESPKIKEIIETPKSSKLLENFENGCFGPRRKARFARHLAKSTIETFRYTSEDLGKVFGLGILYGGNEEKDFIKNTMLTTLEVVSEKKDIKTAVSSILGEDVVKEVVNTHRVPDWQQLYVKLATKFPDKSWQTALNFLNIGRSGKSMDASLLLTNNEIRALKKQTFDITRKTFGSEALPSQLRGYIVNLESILVWSIRENRLHGAVDDSRRIEFCLKLDGRPLAGRDQVSVGVVPITLHTKLKSCQSSLSVYPLAVANCDENRGDLLQLISKINDQKRIVKSKGLLVDGLKYKVTFKVTLDLKALYKLIAKEEDDDFELAGFGTEIEFCFICKAKRACAVHWNDAYDENCKQCCCSKANIGKWSGIRDDLKFLFEEELCDITLCSLHCALRNTEQLVGSLGLFAYKCNSLEECNDALADYGPENTRDVKRITITERKGQNTVITKSNITVRSFAGNTAKKIIGNCEDIVTKSLPLKKVMSYYRDVKNADRSFVLKSCKFTNEMIKFLNSILMSGKFTRDFGKEQVDVQLDQLKEFSKFIKEEISLWTKALEHIESSFITCENLEEEDSLPPPKKRSRKCNKVSSIKACQAMTELAASLHIDYYQKVFQGWKEIEGVMRDAVYEEDENEKIDIFDVKCKLWGFLLRHVFGARLGSGDYGHLTVEHSAMLFRRHRSFKFYSNQGFEASHKVQRALYSRASSHDRQSVNQSVDQMFAHSLSEMMLSLRIQFRQAQIAIDQGKKDFYYRGCGWKKRGVKWSEDDHSWIKSMNSLFDRLYGLDYMKYEYFADAGTVVKDECVPALSYNHGSWEESCRSNVLQNPSKQHATGSPGTAQHRESNPVQTSAIATDEHSCKPHSACCPGAPQHAKPLNKQHPAGCPGTPQNANSSVVQTSSTTDNHSSTSHSAVLSKSNPVQIVLDDDEPDQPSSMPQTPSFQSLNISTVTRREFSNINVPPLYVNNILKKDVRKCFGTVQETDLSTLKERPPERVIQWAEELFKQKRKPSAVCVGKLGCFSEAALVTLRKFCEVDKVRTEVASEETWLDNWSDGLSISDINSLKEVLWNKKMHSTLIKVGQTSIDLQSFSTIAEERYVDNFVIDCVVMKFIEDQRNLGRENSIYLPSSTFAWLSSGDDNFINDKVSQAISPYRSPCESVLLPLHMNGCHWGLIVIDLNSERLLFDDGLKWNPGKHALVKVKKVLDTIYCIQPKAVKLKNAFWNNITDFERFGMPYQGHSGQGSGSCGIGVILAAKDFIQTGLHTSGQFQWSFGEMRKLRKELMLQIVTWSE